MLDLLEIDGTPTMDGTYPITIEVFDGVSTASQMVTIVIAAPALVIDTPSPLMNGMMSMPYGPEMIFASGGTPSFMWELSGSLPPGLTWMQMVDEVEIVGTPTATGTFSFEFTVTDMSSPSQMVSKSFQITIDP